MSHRKQVWNISKGSGSIKDFIKEVLNSAFPNDKIKRQINEDGDKLNIACPYCGDSDKKKSKKRGNIYLSTNTFKCFNDGCMKYAPLTKFISHYCQKFNLSPPDDFLNGKIKETIISNKKTSLLKFLLNSELSEKLITLDYFVNRFSLSKIENFNSTGKAVEYIKNKRFLENNPVLMECCYQDENKEKIFIFNKDNVSNKILGFSVRQATDEYYGPKYRIYSYTEIIKEGLADCKFSLDEIRQIDLLNNYFNILNLNHKKQITILEGQFDSMLIENSMASTGVGKLKDVLLMLSGAKDIKILLDNDKAGRKESLSLLQKGHHVFMWSNVISDLRKKYKDKNKEIKKINDVNDLYKFIKSCSSDLTLLEFNNYINKYFSNSIFDVLSI